VRDRETYVLSLYDQRDGIIFGPSAQDIGTCGLGSTWPSPFGRPSKSLRIGFANCREYCNGRRLGIGFVTL
jgi:hypothetical protein